MPTTSTLPNVFWGVLRNPAKSCAGSISVTNKNCTKDKKRHSLFIEHHIWQDFFGSCWTTPPGITILKIIGVDTTVANWHFSMPVSQNWHFSKAFGIKKLKFYLVFGIKILSTIFTIWHLNFLETVNKTSNLAFLGREFGILVTGKPGISG